MMEALKKGTLLKYLGSKERNYEKNMVKQVEMVKVLPEDGALELIRLRICMAASETETNGSLKLCNLAGSAIHYRDLAVFVAYIG